MLHQSRGYLSSQDVGITSVLFTLVTGVGTAVILQDFFLLRNNDQFPAKQLFTNEPERTTTLAAVQLGFWQVGARFLLRGGFLPAQQWCAFSCARGPLP